MDLKHSTQTVYFTNNKIYFVGGITEEKFLTHQYEVYEYYLKCNICGDNIETYGTDCNLDQMTQYDCCADENLTCNKIVIQNIIK